MEWKDRYPKNIKPAYDELLAFLNPDIRELFLLFDSEMRRQFQVHNKYHRYIKTTGWIYGYGRSYNCELLSVTVQKMCFSTLGVSVKDENSLHQALKEVKKEYDHGFEERYASIRAKKLAGQAERTKKRIAHEKQQMERIMGNIDPEKFNKFKWGEKVSRNDLFRLYQGEASGLIDEDLLDEVGYTFYTRCKQGKETREHMVKGQIICHHCGTVITAGRTSPTGAVLLNDDNDALINCGCGYSYTYREYRRSCNSVNMPGGRATPIFEHFLLKWPTCRSATEKMMLIDWLVHECHVTLMSGMAGRSVCVNLIEGSLKQISDLIIKLAYDASDIEKI